MASSRCTWIALLLLALMTRGVSARAVDFGSKPGEEASGADLRTDALRRWRSGGGAETHREPCAELAAPWQENAQDTGDDTGDTGTLLQLHVRPFSPRASQGSVFPGKSLFSFVRRVYRCCQEGISCRSVKGIQGRLRGGETQKHGLYQLLSYTLTLSSSSSSSSDTDVEFLLTREISSLTVLRAELHLQLSNPQHLDVHPVLSSMAKRGLPTRFVALDGGTALASL
ncbi:uncharacterized protein si:ch211-170d8.2 [Morone saxatilis]|uniref:uncharacterized protein si:ch211-170d8.2 n=1 Tax=Morone saxatilis TaxID=34816 RepID=UPI0015E1F394|nr:uncharacterized protein si:ch211-170d8.2 [Morone saxatilis]